MAKRYDGTAPPSPADSLVFDADERAPGDDLKIVFEDVSRFEPDDKAFATAWFNRSM